MHTIIRRNKQNNSNNNNKIRISCENTVRFSKSEKSVSFDFRQVLSALNASTPLSTFTPFPLTKYHNNFSIKQQKKKCQNNFI